MRRCRDTSWNRPDKVRFRTMTPLLANVGLPMITLQLPWMVMALIPVVLFESLFVRKFSGKPYVEVAKGVAVANLWSTFVGIPIAWALMVILGAMTTGGTALGLESPMSILASVTLQAAWLVPYERHFYWMIPAALGTLLIPSFVASALIERSCLLKRWRDLDRQVLSGCIVRANVYSYLALLIVCLTWFNLEVTSRPLGERLKDSETATQSPSPSR